MQQSSPASPPRVLPDREAIRALGPITLVGQSHVSCIAAALEDAPETIHIMELWKIANPLLMNERPVLEAARDRFGDVVISVLGGSRFDALAMYRHPRPFDFISPLEPEAPLEPDAEIIPYEAMRGTITDMIAHNLSLIDALKSLTTGVMLQVVSPPVWGDERQVSDWDPGFLQRTEAFGSRYLRRKIYRVHSDIVQRFCADRGIELIEPPAEAVDTEGFLKRDYSSDIIHGNRAYGEALAAKIFQRVGELGRRRD